jgi:hypothetical protein
MRLALAPYKSFANYPSVRLLGFKVDAFSLSTTKDRIAAISKLAMPTNRSHLETYIGMATFLRSFVPFFH